MFIVLLRSFCVGIASVVVAAMGAIFVTAAITMSVALVKSQPAEFEWDSLTLARNISLW